MNSQRVNFQVSLCNELQRWDVTREPPNWLQHLKGFVLKIRFLGRAPDAATSHPLWLVVFLTWDKISLKGSRVVLSAVYQTSLLSFWTKRAYKRLINFRHFCCEVWTFENDKLWKGGGNKIDILDLMLQTLFISSFVYDIFISSTLFIFPRRRSRKKEVEVK